MLSHRLAESTFEQICMNGKSSNIAGNENIIAFTPMDVPEDELDELYKCSDVRVVRYRAKIKKSV